MKKIRIVVSALTVGLLAWWTQRGTPLKSARWVDTQDYDKLGTVSDVWLAQQSRRVS